MDDPAVPPDLPTQRQGSSDEPVDPGCLVILLAAALILGFWYYGLGRSQPRIITFSNDRTVVVGDSPWAVCRSPLGYPFGSSGAARWSDSRNRPATSNGPSDIKRSADEACTARQRLSVFFALITPLTIGVYAYRVTAKRVGEKLDIGLLVLGAIAATVFLVIIYYAWATDLNYSTHLI